MLDAVNFEHPVLVIGNARETALSDAQLLERATRERFEVITWITPLGSNHFVQFRDDAVLRMGVEPFEPIDGSRCEFPRPAASSLGIRVSIPIHYRPDVLTRD